MLTPQSFRFASIGQHSRPTAPKRTIETPPRRVTSEISAQRRLIEAWHAFQFHVYSIWLFTFSDLKTIVGPSTVFGIINALAASAYGIDLSPDDASAAAIWARFPLTLFWVWITLLPFAINNQMHPDSIAEDKHNKPWRTMPSGRWTSAQAKIATTILYPVAFIASVAIGGGVRQNLALVFLGTWYNNFGGADLNCWVRNLINALGYVSFTSGALEVALGGRPLPLNWRLCTWFLVIAGVIQTTVHSQDMYDQEGDRIRGRRTVPLVIGDAAARWTVAVPVVFWAFFCPAFWGSGILGWSLSLCAALTVAVRMICLRSVNQDKTTFKVWNSWMTVLYLLPLLSSSSS